MKDFKHLLVLGRGAYGKVYLSKLASSFGNGGNSENLYAIKVMRKDILVEAKKVDNVELEKEILLNFEHQFLC